MKPASRFAWVDSLRGIGIILVFYGHVLQNGQVAGNASAADQFRLIYSFHMPLFFLIAGFFFKPANDAIAQIRRLALRRLLPVAFFGLMLLPLWLRGELATHALVRHDLWVVATDYLRGRPRLSWPSWFLVCLFTCEVMAIFTLGKLRHRAAQLAFGLICIVSGIWICNHGIGRFWFFSEAIVALGCYSIGHASFPWLRLVSERRLVVFVAGALGLALTYRLNPRASDAVMMAGLRQGDALPFLAAALAGSLAAVAASTFLSGAGGLKWLGRNTLPLVGLNGFFFHYLNDRVAARWPFADSPLAVAGGAALVTALSMIACIPAVRLINRNLPQLVGKTAENGPLLPALE